MNISGNEQTIVPEAEREQLLARIYQRQLDLIWLAQRLNQEVLGAYGLLPPHFMVLELLAGRHPQILEGAPAGITVSEIARAMGLAPATTTATLDKLESSGYLRRAADPHDRRVVRVQLTPQGQEVLEALHTRGSALYQDMLSRFGLEELQVLQNILNGVYDWHVERSSANGGG